MSGGLRTCVDRMFDCFLICCCFVLSEHFRPIRDAKMFLIADKKTGLGQQIFDPEKLKFLEPKMVFESNDVCVAPLSNEEKKESVFSGSLFNPRPIWKSTCC